MSTSEAEALMGAATRAVHNINNGITPSEGDAAALRKVYGIPAATPLTRGAIIGHLLGSALRVGPAETTATAPRATT